MRWKAWSSISVAIFWRYMVYRFQEKYKQHRERCRERYRPPTWSRFWISRASGRDFNQPSNTCSWRQIPPIIVKFTRRNTRDYIFSRKRQLESKTAADLGFPNENRLFLNESLTQKSRELLKKVKVFKRNFYFKFVWTKQGKALLQEEESSTTAVHSFSTLEEFVDFKVNLPQASADWMLSYISAKCI